MLPGINMPFLQVSSCFSFCRWITESDAQSILAVWTLELSRDREAYEEVLSDKTGLSKDTEEEGKGEREGERAETLTNHGRYWSSFPRLALKTFSADSLAQGLTKPEEGNFLTLQWITDGAACFEQNEWGLIYCQPLKTGELPCEPALHELLNMNEGDAHKVF